MFVEYSFGKGMTGEAVDVDVTLMGPKEVHKDFLLKSEPPAHLNKKLMIRMTEQMYSELDAQ